MGQLPGLFAMLEMIGVDGILGPDMLSRNKVVFDFGNEEILIM